MPTLDLEQLAELSKPRRLLCGVIALTSSMPDKQVAVLQKALDAPKETYPHVAIHRWLQSAGHHLSVDTIRRHRNHECSCWR